MRALLYSLIFLCSIGLKAQFNMDKFLASAVTDIELQQLHVANSYLASHDFSSPWLRELEIRARSNDSEIGLEDYRLRFGLLNPAERRANKQYHRQLSSYTALRQELELNDVLKQRYDLLIEQVYLHALEELQQARLDFLKTQKRLVISQGRDRVKRILELNQEILKSEMDLIDTDQKQNINNFLISERYPYQGTIEIDTADLVSPKQLLKRFYDKLEIADKNQQLAIEEQQLQVSRYNLEKAENWRNIGFIQAEYDIERGDDLEDHLGYQFGVSIPIFNADRPELEREELEMIEEEAERAIETARRESEQTLLQMNFDYRSRQWQVLNKRLSEIREIKQQGLIDKEAQMNVIEIELELLESFWGLYTLLMNNYISVLHAKGVLSVAPVVNHLANVPVPIQIEAH